MIGSRRRDQVLRAQLDPVDAQFAGRIVDQPLDDVSRLGPSGAAVGCGAVGVGHHRQHRDMGGGDVVDADEGPDIAEGREQVALGRDVGADIGQSLDAEAEEFSVRVERQFGVADIVAGVLVGLDRLAALAGPFDRPPQFLGGEQHQPMLGILPALGAEPAADIAGNDADPAFRDLEDAGRERLAHPVRVLHVGVERKALLARVPHPDRAARFHEMGVDPADHVAALDDVRRRGKGGLGRGPVSGLEQVRDVVRAVGPHRDPALGRGGGVGDRGQPLVIDGDQLGGVLCLRQGLGDDKGDRLADIAHAPLREAEMSAGEHRRAVRALALERHAHGAELGRDEIVAGHDQCDARRRLRSREVERADAGMGVRRAQHIGVELAEEVVVVLETAVAAQQALVLETPHRLPDPELAHCSTFPSDRSQVATSYYRLRCINWARADKTSGSVLTFSTHPLPPPLA